jgi:mRNA-degrading endonuclease toxin of MazEF toxin-antitoxin module
MRVLHLPFNISSQISITVRALRDIGVDAHGLVVNNSLLQDPTGVQTLFIGSMRRHPLRGLGSRLKLLYLLFAEIAKSDIIHWYFGVPLTRWCIELKWIQWLKKPCVVEFWGSDIRIPEVEVIDNPYYTRLGPDYEYYHMEGREFSYIRQEKFARHGVKACLAHPSFRDFLKPRLFDRVYESRGRVILSDFQPVYPSPTNRRPVLVHSPSAKVCKGTATVLAAVNALKQWYDFEFRLIHGVPRFQAIEMVRECDIFLDQFVIGDGYGIAAIEAMALGKPVVCYIKPSALSNFPPEMPVVNANQDNLVEVLKPLLESAQLRYEIGMRSRQYLEQYHDAHKYAHFLVGVYKELIE